MTPLALDIIVGVIIFLSTLIAYMRGLVKEVFTLLGLAAAILVSYRGGHMLIPGLNKWLKVPEEGSTEKVEKIWGLLAPDLAAKVIAYGGTFLIIFIITTLLGFLITRWIKEVGLGIVDRILGAGFGFARGFLLVLLVYVPAHLLIDQKKFPDWAKNSASVPILEKTWTSMDEKFELSKKIEDRGGGIAIKFNKVDPDKIGEGMNQAEEDLKAKIEEEEKEVQKALPEDLPESDREILGEP